MTDHNRLEVRDTARFAKLRRRMIELQLIPRGISDPLVLSAMSEVPRHLFVPEAWREESYDDGPLPIGFGQTISQPLTVAFMLQALQLQGFEKVLDIGTGSGYSAAVLSRLARVVHSVERIPQLASAAAERLARLGYSNVTVHVADGTLGLPAQAPFDAIVVAAGARQLPLPYLDQLSEQGRILIPLGDLATGQELIRFTKREGEVIEENLGLFAFVPLLGKFGWDAPPLPRE
jgi:protein-L-isoaspartate(D-aspartate) O-methyltransferase